MVDFEGGSTVVECVSFDTQKVGANRKDEIGESGKEASV